MTEGTQAANERRIHGELVALLLDHADNQMPWCVCGNHTAGPYADHLASVILAHDFSPQRWMT